MIKDMFLECCHFELDHRGRSEGNALLYRSQIEQQFGDVSGSLNLRFHESVEH